MSYFKMKKNSGSKKALIISSFLVFLTVLILGIYYFTLQKITFAQLSDIHIEAMFEENTVNPKLSERLLKDAISQINNDKKIDFTIITGDIVDAPNNELFAYVTSVFNRLKKPWYYAFGNHDYVFPYWWRQKDLITILENQNPNFIPNGRYYSFSPKKGFTFIGLDGLSEDLYNVQFDFMNNVIKAHPKDTIIIFMHTPILPPIDLSTHIMWQKEKFLENFKQYKQPIAVFAGHFHATKIDVVGNVIHVASPSLKYGQNFRIVSVQNKWNKTVFKFRYMHTNLNEKIPDYSRYTGNEQDKNITIEIKR